MKQQIGFIGLGWMGLPMAQNILKKGYPLTVFNRTREKAHPLLEAGAQWAPSPGDLADRCEVLVSMVSNDVALEEITEGILQAAKKPKIHISMSTISPDLATGMEKRHRERGITFLGAPVSGRPERAKEGSLWIFLAGESKAKERARPILETMSCKIYDLGEQPSQALLFKLCNNFMILGLVEIFGEATAMLEKGGISTEKGAEIWGSSLFDSPVFHSYTPMICKGNFADGVFALKLGLKDMRLLHSCADRACVPMPVLADLLEKLLTSMNLGREEYDWSAIALLTRELAGLKAK